jgi:hypothetical protein
VENGRKTNYKLPPASTNATSIATFMRGLSHDMELPTLVLMSAKDPKTKTVSKT